MKNKFTLLMAFVFLTSAAFSQIGVRLAGNLTNYKTTVDDVSLELDSKFGFAAGVFYRLNAGSSLQIQPELNFAQYGSKFSFDILGTTAESTVSNNYIQIPVLLKYRVGNLEKTNFFFQAGPYAGFGIGKIKTESCAGGDCETTESNYGDEGNIKSTDFGVILGAGVNINSSLFVDFRYGLGLSDLDDDDTSKTNATALNFGIGYSF